MDWTWDAPQIYEIPDEGRAYFNCERTTGYNKAYTDFSHTLAVGDVFEVEIDPRSWNDTNTRQGVFVGFFSNLPSEWIGELNDGVFVYFSNYWTTPTLSFLFYQNGISCPALEPLLLELALYRFRVEILAPHQFSLTIWRDGIFFYQDTILLEDINLTEIEVNYAAIFNAIIPEGYHTLLGRYEGYVNELSLGQ